MDALKYCFSCNFTLKEFVKYRERHHGKPDWDRYKPIIYKDRLLEKWVIECQNCGMEVIFNMNEKGSAELWNNIYRKEKLCSQ